MFKIGERVLQFGRPFTVNDTQYPANWWNHSTPEERENLGIEEIAEESPPDQTYYWVTQHANGSYTSTPKDTDLLLTLKLEQLANYRYNIEIAGLVVANSVVATDRQGQALITGAALQAVIDPGYSVNWKSSSGWVTLDANNLIGVAQLVRGHVQAAFEAEKTHMEALTVLAEANSVANLIAYDFSSGWPEVPPTAP